MVIGGGGSLVNESTTTTTTTTASSISNKTIHILESAPDPFPPPILKKPRLPPKPPPSPFSPSGLAVINRCTIAVQNRTRSQKWSDEYLIRPLSISQLKPNILDLPHRIGGLFCRSGTWFEIRDVDSIANSEETWLDSYRIRGTRNVDSKYALLEFYSIAIGLVSIRGLETKDFLCMNAKGELYPAPLTNYTTECVFSEEVLENYYNSYGSCAHGTIERRWRLAFRHSGAPKKGRHIHRYDVGAQFLVKELNKNFWIPPQVPEEIPKRRNGFDDDGFNWLEKMTSGWQDLTVKKKEEKPSLIGIRNIDSQFLDKYYDLHAKRFPNKKQESRELRDLLVSTAENNIDDKTEIEQNLDARTKAVTELSAFTIKKKKRMEKEERRRRHRRKELEQLRRYPTSDKLRSVARYNHSKALTDRLQNLPTKL
uniref:Uncharacterized protein n=1 Tax=Panagrolaimus sp. JU765 TaxID=591449 RepID=A0AC34QSN5_9BILA